MRVLVRAAAFLAGLAVVARAVERGVHDGIVDVCERRDGLAL